MRLYNALNLSDQNVGEMSTSESEGQVIGCHTDATWTDQLQKAIDNKKLVRLFLCFSSNSIFFFQSIAFA